MPVLSRRSYTGRMEYAATSQLMTGIAGNVTVDIRNCESILRLYKPKVFRFLLASLREKDIAETLTQDCFFKAYQARERRFKTCGARRTCCRTGSGRCSGKLSGIGGSASASS